MSKTARRSKPDKPYEDFPLFPHATRRWAKKYQEQKDDLHAGRTPRVQGAGLTIRDLFNRFLTAKTLMLDPGELSPRTFADYKAVTDRSRRPRPGPASIARKPGSRGRE